MATVRPAAPLRPGAVTSRLDAHHLGSGHSRMTMPAQTSQRRVGLLTGITVPRPVAVAAVFVVNARLRVAAKPASGRGHRFGVDARAQVSQCKGWTWMVHVSGIRQPQVHRMDPKG
jgi:hypothetical protein